MEMELIKPVKWDISEWIKEQLKFQTPKYSYQRIDFNIEHENFYIEIIFTINRGDVTDTPISCTLKRVFIDTPKKYNFNDSFIEEFEEIAYNFHLKK